MKKYTKAKNSIAKNQGITLIALIVTIITMLILASVSLSVLLGNNGVLNRAGKTKKIYDVTSIKEALEIEKGEIGIDRKEVNLDNYLEQIQNGEKAYDLNSTEKIDDKNAEIIVNDEYKFLIKDKENGDVEIIYEGIAKPGDLALSSSSGIYTYPISGTFSVINNVSGGAISATSSNESIATVSVDGNIITVIPGTTAGKAIITVKSAAVGEYAENKATYEATVQNGTISVTATPYTGTYDGNPHDAVTVTTTPSDAKKEYSLNSGSYTTTMPTVTNASSYTIAVKVSKAGYKTETVTKTVTVNKAAGGLTLSATSGTYTYPTSGTFTVTGNTSGGAISATSSNTSIATVSTSGNTITVKPGTTAGKATITVKSAATSNYNEKTATYTATVNNGTISVTATPYTGTYDGKAHNAVTVTTTPSDAKKEYSLNSGSYTTTMPTVTNASSYTIAVKVSKAGYKTETVTKTVTVNKAAGGLTLSATSGTYTYPTSGTFTVKSNTSGGAISATSSNTSIATVSTSGNTITVKPGTTAGKATITVKSATTSNYNEKTATYTATVNNGTISVTATPYTGTYDGKAHNAVTVTTTPSDAKKEYSLNSGSYTTTMPTVTNASSYTIAVKVSKAGYKTETVTKTVTVNKATGGLTLSATSGTYTYPTSGTFTVTGNTSGGTISATSSNTSIATVSVSGNTITVTPTSEGGTATITVKSAATSNYTEKTATYTVTTTHVHTSACYSTTTVYGVYKWNGTYSHGWGVMECTRCGNKTASVQEGQSHCSGTVSTLICGK